MDRYDASDQHLVFEGISDGIDNKFGLESIFYGMGFLTFIIIVALFIDLFFASITSPILYSTFAPVRRRRRSVNPALDPPRPQDSDELLRITRWTESYQLAAENTSRSSMSDFDFNFWVSILIMIAIVFLNEQFMRSDDDAEQHSPSIEDTFQQRF